MSRTGKLYRKMIITYSIVLLIPILCSVFFYQYSYDTVKERSMDYNRNLLETVKSSCDRELLYYDSILRQLSVDNLVTQYIRNGRFSIIEQKWKAVEVQDVMKGIKTSMKDDALFCKDFFLYLKGNGEVLATGAKADLPTYASVMFGMDSEQIVQLEENLNGLTGKGLFSICTGEKNYLLLVRCVFVESRRTDAIVGTWIDTDLFETRIPSAAWNSGTEWALLDANDSPLFMTAGINGHLNQTLDTALENGTTVSIGNTEYIVYNLTSVNGDNDYLLFSSVKLIEESATRIRNAFLICVMVILILGICASRVSVKVTYNPIKQLINILLETNSVKEDLEARLDEYKYLEKQIRQLMEGYATSQAKLLNNRMALRRSIVEKLLFLPKIDTKNTAYGKELYETFQSGMNAVLLFSMRKPEENGDASELDMNFCQDAISTVLAEVVGKEFVQETCALDENVVLIVNLPEHDPEREANLRRLCNLSCEFLESRFSISVCVFAGDFHKDLTGIRESYLEACMTQKFYQDKEEVYICYHEVENHSSSRYHYSYDVEEMVIDALRNGNAELAGSLIESTLDKASLSKEFYLRECMMYDIYTSLIKGAEEMGVGLKKLPYLTKMVVDKPLPVVKQWFCSIVKEICTEAAALTKTSRENELSERIIKYIRSNFTDPDLNVAQIASQFQMTSSYLSMQFKKQTGKSILEVIRQMRLDYAKELLEQGCSVVEAAVQCGFRDSSTFIRNFKTAMGVTPGQIRKSK